MEGHSNPRYSFDRIFLTHLGARLRDQYNQLVDVPLPELHRQLVLALVFAKAGLKVDKFGTDKHLALLESSGSASAPEAEPKRS